MTVNRDTLTSILKEVYLPPVVDQFNSKTLLLKLLRRNRRDFGGRGAYIPVMEQRTHAHGARPDGGTLPDSQSNQYDNMFVRAKFNYAKLKLTGPSMAVARKDEYAFLRTLNAEISGVTEGFINDYNRQLFGNGSAVLTKCTTGSANTGTPGTDEVTVVALDDTDKNGGWGTLYLEPGMIVDIRNEADGAAITGVEANLIVVAVDPSATPPTVSVSQTDANRQSINTGVTTPTNIIADSSIYVAGNRPPGSVNEVMGIHGIINDQDPGDLGGGAGPLQGKPVADNPWWKSSRLQAGGNKRDLSEALLHDIFIACDRRSGLGHEISMLLSSHELWKEYGLTLTPDRRYAGTPDTYEGGFKYLVFNGIKWYFEKYCQPYRVYAPNLNHLTLFEESPVRWDESDGSLLKWRNNEDAFEAFLVYYSELGVDRRQAHTVLEDLNQDLLLPT